ncbi:hypothetical protein Syun_017145 [Stephania yunnanensis]|uniref:Peptide chain release factor domain-containing protein n=1 Tax=Stephania yunnanensis TaxID=152371 RepID=A0AAP0P2T0_9MAGN
MAELDEVVSTYREFKDCEKQLEETKDLAKDSGGDEDMAKMIASEIGALTNQLEKLEDKLKVLLLPSDPLDARNILLEGTGGDEVGLWAGDLIAIDQRRNYYFVSDPLLIKDGSETELMRSVSDPLLIREGSKIELLYSVSDSLLIRDGSETECINSVSDPSLISNGSETEYNNFVFDPSLIRSGSETERINSVSDPLLIRDGSET